MLPVHFQGRVTPCSSLAVLTWKCACICITRPFQRIAEDGFVDLVLRCGHRKMCLLVLHYHIVLHNMQAAPIAKPLLCLLKGTYFT